MLDDSDRHILEPEHFERSPQGMSAYLAELHLRGQGARITWINHWSVQHADWNALEQMSLVGIDGTLLQILLWDRGSSLARTSADLVLPELLARAADSRVALIGGAAGVAAAASGRLASVVFAADGFEEYQLLLTEPEPLLRERPDIIIVSMGAAAQEQAAVWLAGLFPKQLVVTAGGWLDQLESRPQYFPAWVHRLRLGWLIRLVREPKRLGVRYTKYALTAILNARQIRVRLSNRLGRRSQFGYLTRGDVKP